MMTRSNDVQGRAMVLAFVLAATVSTLGCGAGASGARARTGAGAGAGAGTVKTETEHIATAPDAEKAPDAERAPHDGNWLQWAVTTGLWGTEGLVGTADNEMQWSFESAKGASESGRTPVSAAERAAIEKTAKEHGFCDLESGRVGIPDEGKPTLTLRIGKKTCSVTLWDGEWLDIDDAAAVMAVINPIFKRARKSD